MRVAHPSSQATAAEPRWFRPAVALTAIALAACTSHSTGVSHVHVNGHAEVDYARAEQVRIARFYEAGRYGDILDCVIDDGVADFHPGWRGYSPVAFTLVRGERKVVRVSGAGRGQFWASYAPEGNHLRICHRDPRSGGYRACATLAGAYNDFSYGFSRRVDVHNAFRGARVSCAYRPGHGMPPTVVHRRNVEVYRVIHHHHRYRGRWPQERLVIHDHRRGPDTRRPDVVIHERRYAPQPARPDVVIHKHRYETRPARPPVVTERHRYDRPPPRFDRTVHERRYDPRRPSHNAVVRPHRPDNRRPRPDVVIRDDRYHPVPPRSDDAVHHRGVPRSEPAPAVSRRGHDPAPHPSSIHATPRDRDTPRPPMAAPAAARAHAPRYPLPSASAVPAPAPVPMSPPRHRTRAPVSAVPPSRVAPVATEPSVPRRATGHRAVPHNAPPEASGRASRSAPVAAPTRRKKAAAETKSEETQAPPDDKGRGRGGD